MQCEALRVNCKVVDTDPGLRQPDYLSTDLLLRKLPLLP